MDQVRLERARELLTHTGMNLSQIADALGYADAANFTRAFKRWTGTAPAGTEAKPWLCLPRRAAPGERLISVDADELVHLQGQAPTGMCQAILSGLTGIGKLDRIFAGGRRGG